MVNLDFSQEKMNEVAASMNKAALHLAVALDSLKAQWELLRTMLELASPQLFESTIKRDGFVGNIEQGKETLNGSETGDSAPKKGHHKPLTVRDCMAVDPFIVGPTEPLQRAIDLLRRRDIRSIPVIEDGKLVGIVTDRDIRQVAPSYPLFREEDEIRRYNENLKVSAAMTADPMTISPDALLLDAAKLLETYRIHALPVVDQYRLIGIISVTDLLRAFIAQNEQNDESPGTQDAENRPLVACS